MKVKQFVAASVLVLTTPTAGYIASEGVEQSGERLFDAGRADAFAEKGDMVSAEEALDDAQEHGESATTYFLLSTVVGIGGIASASTINSLEDR